MLRKHLSMLYILALLMISAVAITTASASEGDDTPYAVTNNGQRNDDNNQIDYGLRAKTADGQ